MFIDMVAMDMVHMAVVQIVVMAVVLDRLMTAAGAVPMIVLSLMYCVCQRLTSLCVDGSAAMAVAQAGALSRSSLGHHDVLRDFRMCQVCGSHIAMKLFGVTTRRLNLDGEVLDAKFLRNEATNGPENRLRLALSMNQHMARQ